MKNASIIKLVALASLMVLALAGNPKIWESTLSTRTYFIEAENQMQLELRHLQVTPYAPRTFFLDNIAGYNNLDYNLSYSGGVIVTASLQPILSDSLVLTASVTATSGTPITTFKSMFYKLMVYNPSSATINVTGNIIITK